MMYCVKWQVLRVVLRGKHDVLCEEAGMTCLVKRQA